MLYANSNQNDGVNKKNDRNEKDDDDDSFGYKNSDAYKVKMLEKLGLVKSYTKWPQYNRIIYPPSVDGSPTKNPVSKRTFLNMSD